MRAVAWEKAKQGLAEKKPVFAKNIDSRNQISVIYAYNEVGYYTKNWHKGFENSENVIPWKWLGLSQCPCIQCENDRISNNRVVSSDMGLISLDWATPTEPADEGTALKRALEYVIRLNEQGSYVWSGKTYYVGSAAYEKWLSTLDCGTVDRYFFSLFVEILYEARTHAVKFLAHWKKIATLQEQTLDHGIHLFSEIAANYKILNEMYPYEEPRQSELNQKEQCISLVKAISQLENDGLKFLKRFHASL